MVAVLFINFAANCPTYIMKYWISWVTNAFLIPIFYHVRNTREWLHWDEFVGTWSRSSPCIDIHMSWVFISVLKLFRMIETGQLVPIAVRFDVQSSQSCSFYAKPPMFKIKWWKYSFMDWDTLQCVSGSVTGCCFGVWCRGLTRVCWSNHW